jgi:hypothetical protein
LTSVKAAGGSAMFNGMIVATIGCGQQMSAPPIGSEGA